MSTFLSKEDVIFFMYFDRLQAFREKNGHIHVPEDHPLHEWIHQLHQQADTLEDWKKEFLKEEGFPLFQSATSVVTSNFTQ